MSWYATQCSNTSTQSSEGGRDGRGGCQRLVSRVVARTSLLAVLSGGSSLGTMGRDIASAELNGYIVQHPQYDDNIPNSNSSSRQIVRVHSWSMCAHRASSSTRAQYDCRSLTVLHGSGHGGILSVHTRSSPPTCDRCVLAHCSNGRRFPARSTHSTSLRPSCSPPLDI